MRGYPLAMTPSSLGAPSLRSADDDVVGYQVERLVQAHEHCCCRWFAFFQSAGDEMEEIK